MCGIICHISSNTHRDEDPATAPAILEGSIKNRGPDHYGVEEFKLNEIWNGFFAASILHTQGEELAKQPVRSSENDVLLWNGDIFGGAVISEVNRNLSDTKIIFDWLQENDRRIFELPSMIEGPYSFVFYHNERNELWFGRDPLGRHSLLWSASVTDFLITSVGHKSLQDLTEVPAIGTFCLNLSENTLTVLYLHQWTHVPKLLSTFNFQLPDHLRVCVREDVVDVFHFNVDFVQPHQSLFAVDFSNLDDMLQIMDRLLQNPVVENSVIALIECLRNACEKRVTTRRNVCRTCDIENVCSVEHAKLGVSFSGGLDSTIIAYLADKFVPMREPIDLLNVAFSRNNENFEVPDRKTGLLSLEELRFLCPQRKWNFVEINVSNDELETTRKNHVCHLIYPLETIIDDSLGCALWFACRGRGTVDGFSYISSAKIVLLGNGADEQLGGYTRHRNILRRNGWKDLGEQLLKETLEISKRNLGRDDRIACDSGRQPRFPFLDEQFVKYVSDLRPWEKCGPASFPRGLGDKLILRLAAVKLGLRRCAVFPKRAFQFGCRIANSKEKGDDKSNRL